jgi:hypothetical protein
VCKWKATLTISAPVLPAKFLIFVLIARLPPALMFVLASVARVQRSETRDMPAPMPCTQRIAQHPDPIKQS